MKIIIKVIAIFTFSLLSSVSYAGEYEGNTSFEKKRLSYYQGGDYIDYYKLLRSIAISFQEIGLISNNEIPDFESQSSAVLWEWLANNVKSGKIEFVKDAFYSGDWDESLREEQKLLFINRLNTKKDIDLVLGMGTWAGLDLANDLHKTPTMIMSSSDPINSGIVSSITDSGYDHVHAFLNPERFLNQLKIFHDLIGFKRLGIAFENTKVGRSYAAVDTIYAVAKERGFVVVPCYTQSDIPNEEKASQSVIDCFNYLADKVDGFYVTEQGGLDLKTHEQVIAIANLHKIPAFSQYGQDEVRLGYMLSASRSFGLIKEGRFLVGIAMRIFNGEKPRSLNQVYEDNPDIYLNMKTAEIIGFHLNAYLLAAADKLYWRIESQE